jgi:2-polyprenyl-6-methoxyphenol hydroxylase-like FAD-dependent oxidoreductase
MLRTPVLIVGGSLVGLSASLFLSWRGVPHVVVEKHPGSSLHPRAIGFMETTLEHYRMVGIGSRIPQVPAGTRLRRVTVESLCGAWISEEAWTPGEGSDRITGLSPCTGAAIAQDKLEPILREATVERGADLRLNTELLGFEQDDNRVIARLRDRTSGNDYELATHYMIAADGADSAIREALGIQRIGVGHLRVLRSVLFHCPEADAWLSRGAQQFSIEQEGFRAFLTTYGDSRWVLMLDGDHPRSEEELRAAIRRALGRDMPFDILTAGRWEMAGRIATSYRQGRIFLAGDSAHQLPPTRGGFGANTGIDDVWNLAWKLKRVVDGSSTPSLLDTYDAERRPIGWLRHQQTFSRPDYARWVGADFMPEPLLGDDAMEFGQLVRSAAVVGAGPELPAAASPKEWAGQPGTRAPHVWVERGGETVSTLDLLGEDFVLISGAADGWRVVANSLALTLVGVGDDVLFPQAQPFAKTFGVSSHGAVLVRPDGVIAWRSDRLPNEGAEEELRAAFAHAAMS